MTIYFLCTCVSYESMNEKRHLVTAFDVLLSIFLPSDLRLLRMKDPICPDAARPIEGLTTYQSL